MKNVVPTCQSTKIGTDFHIWIPSNFENFSLELDYLISSCSGNDPRPLFRGHTDSKWILESTFARTCKRILFNLPPHVTIIDYIRNSIEYHNVLLNLLLLKFGVLCRPSQELEDVKSIHDVDPWFELMRRWQQFPQEDSPYLKGTFFIDWTKSKDVALYFANNNREGDGALYICDAVSTGKTYQKKTELGQILDLMSDKGKKGEAMGCPLLFHFPRQIKCLRANNQEVIYFAQMDLRHSLDKIWELQERKLKDEYIFIKLILPNGAQDDCNKYLLNKGITDDYIYPSIVS